MTLLIVTQAVDATHPALGFFIAWIQAFRQHPSITSVRVICLASTADAIEGVTVTCIGGGSRLQRLWRYWQAISADQADAVFVHMTPPWLVLGWPVWAFRRVRTALWYTHGSSSMALQAAVRLASVTLTATQNAFPFPHSRVQAVGHGIASAYGAVSRPPRPAHRAACLAVGRVAPRKRVRETLALFAEIRKQEPHATLTWVGSVQADHDPYTKAVQEDVTRLGLADAVRWERLTPQDMPQAYATHDLLLHLSATGSLDKVIPESLAAGCAVFSTNPATIEAVGEKWGWSGRADQDARAEATEALHRMDQGVSSDEREQAARTFSLQGLIQRIIHVLIDKK